MKIIDIYETIKGKDDWNEKTEAIISCYDETLKKMQGAHPDMYNEMLKKIYIKINGCHFNQKLLNEAFKDMVNDNGTKAPKWSLEETAAVARQANVVFDNFNEYDWSYVMNMFYSDYIKIFGDNLNNYIEMSKKFLNDKDGPKGKALLYYFAMNY